MRHDSNSQFTGKATGLGTYGYQLTADWRAHISYGTAYRAPNFNELYFPDTGFGGGNSKLNPELATNLETEVNWERGAHRFSAVYFNNHIKNLISGWPPMNINQATLSGSTFSYDGHLDEWALGVSGDFLRAFDKLTGQRLARRAEHLLKSHLTRAVGKWNLGGEWQLVGSRYDDAANTRRMGGYGVVNLTTDYRLERNWVLFARANNIFNKDYELAHDYATPQSSLFIGIRYSSK
jgi:vitamin B12 transporter